MVGARQAPVEVVRQLREVLPDTDLISLPNGEWMLGRWAPFHAQRCKAATELLASELSLPQSRQRDDRVAMLRLFLAGFRTILPNPDSPIRGAVGYRTEHNFGRIREELREKEYGLQQASALFDAMVEESVDDAQAGMAAVLDRMEAEGPSDHRIIHRHRVSMRNPRNWN